ncbi:hypothetical protein, partial [Ralstonia solanacearum]
CVDLDALRALRSRCPHLLVDALIACLQCKSRAVGSATSRWNQPSQFAPFESVGALSLQRQISSVERSLPFDSAGVDRKVIPAGHFFLSKPRYADVMLADAM